MEEIDINCKPEKWPANAIECQLENIMNQLENFKINPNYKNKEVLISLISNYDLNQSSLSGMMRTTKYEVACINLLILDAYALQLNTLKVYLYELVGAKTRMQKMLSWQPIKDTSIEIKEFNYLFSPLKLYYQTYQKYIIEKNKNYSEQLIEFIEEVILMSSKTKEYQKIIENITKTYISLLNDLSYFRCKKRTRDWAFSRKEIYNLYELASKLFKLNGDIPIERPLKGVLMTSISNYVLKSRNNYNDDYIYKYISPNVAKQSILNHQIWISPIEQLNDEREQKVLPEILKNVKFKDYPWVKEIDFTPKRHYYVSSFCKSANDKQMMSDYGECVYGYKDDRMAEILAPTIYSKDTNYPVFSQVIAFDVIYDKNEIITEIRFLCSVIDCFEMEDKDKRKFLEEILQYWILSVKDKKWAHERERRYVLFMYDDYNYIEVELNDKRFFKLKSSLFIEPDFILGHNPVKWYLKEMIDNKRNAIYMKPYLFCYDCFNRDFDVVTSVKIPSECPICHSTNINIENKSTY